MKISHKKIIYVMILILLICLLPVLGFDINIRSIISLIVLWLIIIASITGYKQIYRPIKNNRHESNIKKYSIATIGIIFLICIFTFFFGIIVFFYGTPFMGTYNVDEVKVVDSTFNSVTIDYTKYNHDDDMQLTIKKPFFIKVNNGDIINVRYHIDNPKKMHYVIDSDLGSSIIVFSILLFTATEMLLIFILIIELVIMKIQKHRMIMKFKKKG